MIRHILVIGRPRSFLCACRGTPVVEIEAILSARVAFASGERACVVRRLVCRTVSPTNDVVPAVEVSITHTQRSRIDAAYSGKRVIATWAGVMPLQRRLPNKECRVHRTKLLVRMQENNRRIAPND